MSDSTEIPVTPPHAGVFCRAAFRRQQRRTRRYRAAVQPRRPWWARTIRSVIGLVVVVAVAVPALTGTAVLTYLFAPLPAEPVMLDSLASSAPSVVVDASGAVLATFEPEVKRTLLGPGDIPEVAVTALLAAEDRRFFEHSGLDLAGLIRAAKVNWERKAFVQGGSTLTQQLVKNRRGDTDRTVARKVREALVALRVDRSVPKDEILTAYLNTVYFGAGAYGLEAAAQTYFGHGAATLTLSEAALLVGAIPAPARYSARVDPVVAEARRQLVLDSVAAAGFAEPDVVTAARAELPVLVAPTANVVNEPYFVNWVVNWLDSRGISEDVIYGGGLRIETTLDPRLQAAARSAADQVVPAGPEVSVVAVEPGTGQVRAMLGGRDFAASQVNVALGAAGGGSGRQPGSTFKTFVLAQALADGETLESRIDAPAAVQPAGFIEPVRNSDGRGYGKISLADAMRRSSNTAFINLTVAHDPARVADLAVAAGVTDMEAQRTAGPALGIGKVETSPLQLASGYATFAAGGMHHEPVPVSRVVDGAGNAIFDIDDLHANRVVSASVAADVTAALRGVVEAGTGRAAAVEGRPVAGKTGTTDDNVDALFVGYAPQLVTAVWVGFPQGRVPMRNLPGLGTVQGGTAPAQVFSKFMTAALAPLPVVDFGTTIDFSEVTDQFDDAATGTVDVHVRRPMDLQPRPERPVTSRRVGPVRPPTAPTPTTRPQSTTSTTTPPPTSTSTSTSTPTSTTTTSPASTTSSTTMPAPTTTVAPDGSSTTTNP